MHHAALPPLHCIMLMLCSNPKNTPQGHLYKKLECQERFVSSLAIQRLAIHVRGWLLFVFHLVAHVGIIILAACTVLGRLFLLF
jgi:hypothetical protein